MSQAALVRPIDPSWQDVLPIDLPARGVIELYEQTRGDSDTLATWLARNAADPFGGIFDMDVFAGQIVADAFG